MKREIIPTLETDMLFELLGYLLDGLTDRIAVACEITEELERREQDDAEGLNLPKPPPYNIDAILAARAAGLDRVADLSPERRGNGRQASLKRWSQP